MLFYAIASVLLVGASATFYTDCGSKLATVQNVGVSGCKDTASECTLRRNTNVTITIEFTPTREVRSVETEVHGIIMDLPVPFPLPQPDACKDNGLTCPLKANDKVTYTASLPILKTYPQINVKVKWELKSEDDEDVVCIVIQARLR